MSGNTPKIKRWEDARFFTDDTSAVTNRAEMTAWYNSGGILLYGREFTGSASTVSVLPGHIQLPHGYSEGTAIYPHLHIVHFNAGANAVARFNLDYGWATPNGSFTYATQAVNFTCTASDSGKHKIVSFASIAMATAGVSTLVPVRIWRDAGNAADTYGSSVWMLDADAHVLLDTIGSNSETSKN